MNVTTPSRRSGTRRTGRRRSVLLTAAVLAAGFGGYTAASATGGDQNPNVTASRAGTTERRAAPRLIDHGALIGGQTETYTGITPCRIIDTRNEGGPISNTARHYRVSGGLSAQGGADTCDIPYYASSIVMNVTGISAGGTGYMRALAYGSGAAGATVLNYSPALNATNQVNVPLCRKPATGANPCGGGAFTVRNVGTADLVADAIGYYAPPIFARVSGTGVLVESSGVYSVARTPGFPVGNYTIVFDREVRECSAAATDINWNNHNDVSIDLGNNVPNHGEVAITKADGSYRSSDFYLTVTC